jgi:hypothetical protein
LSAVNDNWRAEDLTAIASGAPQFASEIEGRVEAIRERKERSLIETVLGLFHL